MVLLFIIALSIVVLFKAYSKMHLFDIMTTKKRSKTTCQPVSMFVHCLSKVGLWDFEAKTSIQPWVFHKLNTSKCIFDMLTTNNAFGKLVLHAVSMVFNHFVLVGCKQMKSPFVPDLLGFSGCLGLNFQVTSALWCLSCIARFLRSNHNCST